MSSSPTGIHTSPNEVTNISHNGFWLLADDKEYFVPFGDYPQFRQANVAQIYDVQCLGKNQFHWPALDTDFELYTLENPGRFPLKYKP